MNSNQKVNYFFWPLTELQTLIKVQYSEVGQLNITEIKITEIKDKGNQNNFERSDMKDGIFF